ncbi:MFS general substrate transporter [Amylostereum chailletii]|nr:MFS general substrate transporter [Amylostereum chailletii]
MSTISSPASESRFEVAFADDDPEDPIHWPRWKKIRVVASLCVLSFTSVFGSSSYAPGQTMLQEKYGVNVETVSAGLTLYVLGFAAGPLICPLSEMYGRRIAYTLAWPFMIAATAPSAFVNNITVILIFRFLTGCGAACALNNGSGVIMDMYRNDVQAQGRGIFFCPLSGPCIGSLVGFFIAAVEGDQLWVVRAHFFLSIAVWPCAAFLPETHGPTLLARRGKKLRAAGNVNAYAAHERHGQSTQEIMKKHIMRPMQMLLHEPISQGAALWVSLAYSIVYFFFEAYPVVFIKQHNIPPRLCGLMFLPIPVGMLMMVAPYEYLTRWTARIPLPGIDPKGSKPHPAEQRLKVVLPACALLPVSLFWFAWTSGPEIHWAAPALAGVAFGYAMMAIFMCFLTYLAQVYKVYASSATAGNAVARSIMASIFPVAANSLLNTMGSKWGMSLFGFLSLGLIPIPLIFIRYGEQLRVSSKLAREAQEIVDRLQRRETDTDTVTNVGDVGVEEKRAVQELRRSAVELV